MQIKGVKCYWNRHFAKKRSRRAINIRGRAVSLLIGEMQMKPIKTASRALHRRQGQCENTKPPLRGREQPHENLAGRSLLCLSWACTSSGRNLCDPEGMWERPGLDEPPPSKLLNLRASGHLSTLTLTGDHYHRREPSCFSLSLWLRGGLRVTPG